VKNKMGAHTGAPDVFTELLSQERTSDISMVFYAKTVTSPDNESPAITGGLGLHF
jgi:hypothetical protein